MSHVYGVRRAWWLTSCTFAVLVGCVCHSAQSQEPPPYGEPISLDQARKVIAAAEVEAKKNKWPVAIAVVDGAGFLVAFARLDNTQLGSVEVALQKAKTSALFRRPTKVFEDGLAALETTKIARCPARRRWNSYSVEREGDWCHRRFWRQIDRRCSNRHRRTVRTCFDCCP